MRRLQLVELAELSWCPASVRDGLTDCLRWMIDAGDSYAAAVPLLADALRSAPTHEVVDLCAGGGGPWQSLRPALAAAGTPVRVHLTDRFPNHAAFAFAELQSPGMIRGDLRAIDAACVPADLRGMRTMFSAFHHFRPDRARAILADAVAAGQGIAIFEATRRDGLALAVTMFAPLFMLVAAARVRPFRWSRLFWTYVIPAIPLVALWDGIVSCLRTYRPAELEALAHGIGGAHWRWRAGESAGKGPIPVTWLIGLPVP